VLLASGLVSTGLCTSLSAGPMASCPVADAPEHDACCDQESNETCPEAPAHPTCRMCDDTVAFLLKEKTAGDDVPSATFALAPTLAPRPSAAIGRTTDSLYFSALSASPPIHLLNATFRN
jgi:hypothetical protein